MADRVVLQHCSVIGDLDAAVDDGDLDREALVTTFGGKGMSAAKE
jgi:hypothetical protein